MTDQYYVVPREIHDKLVVKAYLERGFTPEESASGARMAASAAWHGIRTHNALKALHLDEHLGSGAGGCQPSANIEIVPSDFEASQVWNAHRKMGQAVAYEAMHTCKKLADRFGLGMVSVDNAFHYLWGGGYVMEAAQEGYIAYTNCTSAMAEVVPFMGRNPTLGTNPHSWGFPTTEAIGYPIVIDWATSVIAMGRVQQLVRENLPLPPNAAIDADGRPTTNAAKAAALLPFGGHKGYGLSLINELMAALIGGSLPTFRGRPHEEGEKNSTCFFFQVIHPGALSSGAFVGGRGQKKNVKAVIKNILGPGNENCLLPGQIEAEGAARSEKNNGLLFTAAEIGEFNKIAAHCGAPPWNLQDFPAAI